MAGAVHRVERATTLSRAHPVQALLTRLAAREEQAWLEYLPSSIRAQRVPSLQEVQPPSGAGEQPRALGSIGIVGRVWLLARHSHGCRWVQQALRSAHSDVERISLAMELRGHVLEASRCPNANYVLQRCITTVPHGALQFMIEEITAASVRQVAKHKYGCRIIQRLLERCPSEQTRPIIDAIFEDLVGMSKHPYGTYVVQNIVANGAPADRAWVQQSVLHDLRLYCMDMHGRAIVSAILDMVSAEERRALCERLLREPGLAVDMAETRPGAELVVKALRDGGATEAMLAATCAVTAEAMYGHVVAESGGRLPRRGGA